VYVEVYGGGKKSRSEKASEVNIMTQMRRRGGCNGSQGAIRRGVENITYISRSRGSS
jgi:hypothetical protein